MSGNWPSSWSSDATPQNTPSTNRESGNNSWSVQPHSRYNSAWGAQPEVKPDNSWGRPHGHGATYKVEANTSKSKAGNNSWSESDQGVLNLSKSMREMNTNLDAYQNITSHVQRCSRCTGWGCEECSLLVDPSTQAENSGWGNMNNNVDHNSRQSNWIGHATTCNNWVCNGQCNQQQEVNDSWGNAKSGDNQNNSKLMQNSQQADYQKSNNDGWGGPLHGSWDDQNGASAQSKHGNNGKSSEQLDHGSWGGGKIEAVYSRSGKTVMFNVNNSNASQPSKDEPETALATFPYEFTTVPNEFITGSGFKGLCKINPAHWPRVTPQYWATKNKNESGWGSPAVTKSQWIKDIAREENGAAHLLLTIFWFNVIGPGTGVHWADEGFWWEAQNEAVDVLFSFEGAPERYLGWVQNVNRKNKGHLKDIVSENGQVFFTVNMKGTFIWLSDDEGQKLSVGVIGKLPPVKLRVI